MRYQWYFAAANGGATSGLNDSGVSYFESEPIRSIARETLQDSIDARHSNESKTIVKFNSFNVSHYNVPDYENLYKAFQSGMKRWNHHEDTTMFFKSGLEMLERDAIPVLAIQDYQTTGLTRIGDPKTGGWYTLISSSGVTEKSSTDGGSFGIGKNAPFAASALRTVLYSTKNRENEIGFQGVAKIPTITNKNNEDTQGIGYYYDSIKQQPIKRTRRILKPFQRHEYGTDKYVLGFNGEKDWEKQLIDEIISSYLIAIHRENLEVHVNNFVINKSTLPKTIEIIRGYNPDSIALQYYEVLHSSLSREFKIDIDTDINKKETVTLHLLAKDGFKKRVGLHRSTGMKIFDKGHFRTPLDFSGVFIVEGERLNSVLRKTEPPTHDRWDPKRFKENIKYAEKLIREINRWINECAKSLLKNKLEKNIQIKGIEELLPDLSEGKPKTIQLKKDSLKDQVKVVRSKKRRNRKRKPDISIPASNGVPGEKLGSKREGDPKEFPTDSKKRGSQKALVSQMHVYCTRPSEQVYSIIFTPQSEGEVTFKINAVGESGVSTAVDILDAQMGNFNIPVVENVVGPFKVNLGNDSSLDIKINTANRLALEVSIV